LKTYFLKQFIDICKIIERKGKLQLFCRLWSEIGVVDMAGMRQWREQARRVSPSTLNPTKRYKGGPHHHIPENKYKSVTE
jgi:hypothetical protein